MFKQIIFAGCVAGVIAAPTVASASTICAERDAMITKLKDKYGEVERGMGLSGAEAVVEIWSSDKTGTWTIVMTRPNGVTCVVAAGDSWIDAPHIAEPEI